MASPEWLEGAFPPVNSTLASVTSGVHTHFFFRIAFSSAAHEPQTFSLRLVVTLTCAEEPSLPRSVATG